MCPKVRAVVVSEIPKARTVPAPRDRDLGGTAPRLTRGEIVTIPWSGPDVRSRPDDARDALISPEFVSLLECEVRGCSRLGVHGSLTSMTLGNVIFPARSVAWRKPSRRGGG